MCPFMSLAFGAIIMDKSGTPCLRALCVLPLQSVAPSKLPRVPSPPPSVLCPWVTSSADVNVIITSVPATFKIRIYC